MSKDIIKNIRLELDKLAISEYRQEQNVYASPKEIKLLRRLLENANTLRENEILSFSRCVSDMTYKTSRLSQLTSELSRKAIPDGSQLK